MRSVARVLVVVALVGLGLGVSPLPASAVTSSMSDPTGDTTLGSTYDISALSVSLTASTVSVTVTTVAALPALTDPSWATADTDGRTLFVELGEEMGTSFLVVDGDGGFAIGPNEDRFDACLNAVASVTGNTVTVSAPAECFSYPGKIRTVAELFNSNSVNASEFDVAIAGPISETTDLSAVTHVEASLNAGGYYELGADGGVFSFGGAPFYGSTGNLHLNAPVVGMAVQPAGNGYRFVASDGGIFAYGSAPFFGSMGGKPLNQPIVGMAATPTGNGYWLVARDGGIFAYGDAAFYGSMGGQHLNKPIVGMASTPTGHGYWMVASDGGIFAFGDARFYGSTGGTTLNSPVISMIPSSTGQGYLLIARDGGVFAYGNSSFHGSGANHFDDNVVAAGRQSGDNGYYLVGDDGEVVNYGTDNYYGDIWNLNASLGNDLNSPIVGFAVKN